MIIGKDEALHNYVAGGANFNGLALNVWMAIAVILSYVGLFAILAYATLLLIPLLIVFSSLIRPKGWVLGILIFVVTWFPVRAGIVSHNLSLISFAGQFAIIIYIGAWVYANIIFNRYEKTARQRVSEIDKESSPSTNDILEKGILLQAVLGQNSAAQKAIEHALLMEDGDALFWYHAAIVLGRIKRYSDELKALELANAALPDEKLKKQIEELKGHVQKRL